MTREKKEYQKPTLERLALIPRENVLADCFQPVTGSGDQFSLTIRIHAASGRRIIRC